LGYCPELVNVPEIVVGHVRGKLELDEDVPAAHESDRTLWRHRDPVAATAYRLGHPIPSSHPIRAVSTRGWICRRSALARTGYSRRWAP
jgi:hypothetical protein